MILDRCLNKVRRWIKMVWVDWVTLAFEHKTGNVKNLNYEEEMEKLNNLKKQQLCEKSQLSTNYI